jgi:hypothetical protein
MTVTFVAVSYSASYALPASRLDADAASVSASESRRTSSGSADPPQWWVSTPSCAPGAHMALPSSLSGSVSPPGESPGPSSGMCARMCSNIEGTESFARFLPIIPTP